MNQQDPHRDIKSNIKYQKSNKHNKISKKPSNEIRARLLTEATLLPRTCHPVLYLSFYVNLIFDI